ncbi:hypothetical protein LTS18_014265, partial [Coniosporium uncinatum]
NLYLDDCPILYQIIIYSSKDAEGYFLDPKSPDYAQPDGQNVWSYKKRWHNYFDTFRVKITHLREFRIGHGLGWNDAESDGRRRHVSEEYYDLATGLTSERYMVFDEGIGPSQFTEYPSSLEENVGGDGPLPEKKPRCGVDDLMALRRLLMKTGQYEPGKEKFSGCGRVFGLLYEDTARDEPEILDVRDEVDIDDLKD